jgi:hypothetical protein
MGDHALPPVASRGRVAVLAERWVGPFADRLLATDLPRLPDEQRRSTVAFVATRVGTLPGIMLGGVTAIAAGYRALLAVPGGWPLARALARLPLPLLAEYPRLIRSLGYAYVWEQWPDLRADGGH